MSARVTLHCDVHGCEASRTNGAHPESARKIAEGKGWVSLREAKRTFDYCPEHAGPIRAVKARSATTVADDVMAAVFGADA